MSQVISTEYAEISCAIKKRLNLNFSGQNKFKTHRVLEYILTRRKHFVSIYIQDKVKIELTECMKEGHTSI